MMSLRRAAVPDVSHVWCVAMFSLRPAPACPPATTACTAPTVDAANAGPSDEPDQAIMLLSSVNAPGNHSLSR